MNTDGATCGGNACEAACTPMRAADCHTTARLSEATVLARIMAALDNADAWTRSQVFDILNARGFDGELSAGDVLAVSDVLELPAGVLLVAPRDDLGGVDDVAGGYADSGADVY